MMFDHTVICETQANNIAEQADKFLAKDVQFMWVTQSQILSTDPFS